MISGHQRASSAGPAPGRSHAGTRRAIVVALASAPAAVAMLAAVAGCASHGSVSYRGVCENVRTHVRVADRRGAAPPPAAPGAPPGQMAGPLGVYGSRETPPADGFEG